jgi:hypothetical protein
MHANTAGHMPLANKRYTTCPAPAGLCRHTPTLTSFTAATPITVPPGKNATQALTTHTPKAVQHSTARTTHSTVCPQALHTATNTNTTHAPLLLFAAPPAASAARLVGCAAAPLLSCFQASLVNLAGHSRFLLPTDWYLAAITPSSSLTPCLAPLLLQQLQAPHHSLLQSRPWLAPTLPDQHCHCTAPAVAACTCC